MFIEGIEPVFRADVPNGKYIVDVWNGDMDYQVTVRMEISTDDGSEWTMFGWDESTDSPLPWTFMTYFQDSGSPGQFLLEIPDGKTHYYANYTMSPREFLQVHVPLEVTQEHILFRIGSTDRFFNAIEITELPPTCQGRIDIGYKLAGDLNVDCYVDFLDFTYIAGAWMECDDPNDVNCNPHWQ